MNQNLQNYRPVARKMSGVTLIELMVVVAIVGILAGVAYPGYQEYGRRAKRAEARAFLMDAAARMERYYSDRNQYTTDLSNGADGANIATTSEKGHYTLGITLGANNQTFTFTATPSGFTDAKCGALTLTSQGQQGEGGTGSVDDCWGR